MKLHTDRGKTLIGLLILQSYLNELEEPVVCLWPNNYLIQQICEKAKSFGINFTTADDNLPDDFREGRKILIELMHIFNEELKEQGIGRFTDIKNQVITINILDYFLKNNRKSNYVTESR